ncbi:uncharacterized protein abcb10 [Misgurnus anguillicaudatus]|uniref:uncharacterized protein abcb10 n=1 Tax=Misgurnus anguillicaudatus TaxID=75329 RepID=UPI003CCFDF57
MYGTMLRMPRITVGKALQCNRSHCRSERFHHSRISWKRQVCRNGSSDGLVLPVYKGKNISQLSCLRPGGLFLTRFVWKLSRQTIGFYSTSTDSKQTSTPLENQDSKVSKSENSLHVPSGDVKKLLNLIYPQRWRLSAAVGFLVVNSSVTMSAPFFLGRVIDTIYTSPTDDFTASLTSLCIMLTGVFLCGGAANAARIYLIQTSGQQIVRNLRESLFSSILKQEVGFFDKNRTGELINRLSADTVIVGRCLTDNLSHGLRSLAQAGAGIGMMLYVSPSLTAFVLMVVPSIAFLALMFGQFHRSISRRMQDALAAVTQLAEERISNIRTVRAFGKELIELQKYAEKIDHVLEIAKKEAVVTAGYYGVTGLSIHITMLSVLYKGGLLMASEAMTVGQISSFLMYAFWVGISIEGFSSFYSELMKGLGAGTRLWELMDRKPEFPLSEGLVLRPEQLKGELEFQNVSFAYPTRKDASIFQDLSLHVPAGSVMAVVGPSGSGKSTLVSLLLRLYDPDSGIVTVDGHDIRDLSPYWLRSHIGTVSQEPVLFSCSIAENIAYGATDPSQVKAQDIYRAAQIANAHDFIQDFPKGYDTVVGEKGVLLSGGQKQRVAIARALLKNPKILLLDEATSALDTENEYLVQEALDRLMHNRTVLIIAHRLSTIQSADAVAVLDQHRVVEIGSHAQLLANDQGLFRKLMEKQAFMQAEQKQALLPTDFKILTWRGVQQTLTQGLLYSDGQQPWSQFIRRWPTDHIKQLLEKLRQLSEFGLRTKLVNFIFGRLLIFLMYGTMLRIPRFTVGKVLQCSISCCRPDRFHHSRISWKRQVYRNGSDVVVLPVYKRMNISQLPCLRHEGLFASKFLAKHSRHTIAFYSTSTDSKQTSTTVENQDSKVSTSENSLHVPSGDVKKLLNLAHPQRWRLSAAVGFLVVSSAVTMSAPFFLGRVIDTIYTSPTEDFTASLTSLCIMLTGVFLCGGAANAARVYLMQISGQQIVRNLRESLFSSILRQEVGFFDKTRTGELINRLSADTTIVGRCLTDNLSDGLRSLAQAGAGVGMMLYVSPSLAAFVLMIVPPVALMAVIFGRFLRSISRRTQDALAAATQLAEERISNMRTVRAFGKELTELQKYAEKVDHVLELAKKEAVVSAGFYGVTGLSGNVIMLSVLYKGGLLMASEAMTVGQLSSFLMYAFWVGISIAGFSSFYSELMKGLGAGTRLWELMDRKPEFPLNEGLVLRPEQLKGELEFRNVSFAYPTRKDASIFQNLSLHVPAGSVMAVVGPSGSGKSTLVSLLLRLYDPDSGMVTFDGHDIRDLNPYWLRSHIGTVSQEPVLFSCSIAENIAYGATDPSQVRAQDIYRAAQIANAHDFIQDFPKGYDTVVGEKGVLLSGGQKQRVAIARAMLKNPKILLLDEATSALDAENEYLVQEALDRLMHNRTVLIIAHRLSTIQSADAVAVLDQHRVVEIGSHAQLLANDQGLFRKLMEKQAFMQAEQKQALLK